MHIELTDHLRCPKLHPEAYLVLLPDRMDGRRVAAGHLGCPVCGWSTAWSAFVPDFGSGWRSSRTPSFDGSAAHAMLGITGPGGWIALAGAAGALAPSLSALLPGVALVAVNPPENVEPSDVVSVLLSDEWPLKSHSMRGVVLGGDAAHWRDSAMATVLPGLRTVGEGAVPSGSGVQVLGDAGGVWVATTR
ncbi:MAG: hypothetical protein ACREK8_08555 [Gemmatimonadales bacterium]